MAKPAKNKTLRAVIAILLALVLLTVGALMARVVYLRSLAHRTVTSVVPENLIGEVGTGTQAPGQTDGATQTDAPAPPKATAIALHSSRPSDNRPFQAVNMLPGDVLTQYYAITVSHHADVAVYFDAAVTEQTKSLADVLHIRVTHLENGKVLYDGSFADVDMRGYGESFAATESTETLAHYAVTVSLPTWADNEYQAARLMADFIWSVRDTDGLDAPQTGDSRNIFLYFLIMCYSLAAILLLLLSKRTEREAGHGK